MPHPLLALSAARSVSELIPTAFVALLYARRAHTLAGTGRSVPRWRQVCFYAGILIAAVAILALGHAASVSLYWRIVQLLLVGDLATLLIVLGLNAALLAPLLRTRIMQRLRVLSNPPLAFALWTANLYLWLVSPLYPAALEHEGIRALQDLCFVVFGINMWICLLGPLPMRPLVRGRREGAVHTRGARRRGGACEPLPLVRQGLLPLLHAPRRRAPPLAARRPERRRRDHARRGRRGHARALRLALPAHAARRAGAGARVRLRPRADPRVLAQPQPRPRRAPAPARGAEPRRRRFQPEADAGARARPARGARLRR